MILYLRNENEGGVIYLKNNYLHWLYPIFLIIFILFAYLDDNIIWLGFWIAVLLPMLLEALYLRNAHQKRIISKTRLNRKKGFIKMNEAIKNFIDKECIITPMNASLSGQIVGVLESVEDNWVTIRGKKGKEVVNVDYISRIQERGKKSSS